MVRVREKALVLQEVENVLVAATSLHHEHSAAEAQLDLHREQFVSW